MATIIARMMLMALVFAVDFEPARATTFFLESFDDGETAIESRWAASCPPFLSTGVFSLDSSQKVSGGFSMKEVVNGLTTRTPEFLGRTCFIDKSLPGALTLYTRWHERTQSGFVYDPSNVKSVNVGPCCAYPSWWWGHFNGSPIFSAQGQNISDGGIDDAPGYGENINPLATPLDTWVCMETQITMNTPGQNDGVLRIWMDGTLRGEYLNQNFRGAVTDANNNASDATFTLFRIYSQHGVGTRWFDDIVAADTRIGCSGDPQNTTPPATPVGLTIR
jgi:hypothetical protein